MIPMQKSDFTMSRDIITVFFDDWLSRSPDGHRFSQMPWELDWFTTATELPFYRKPYKVPTPKITWSMIAITVVSILLNYPLPASLGAGFLVLLFLSCKEAWEQSGALLLTVESTKVTAHEREEFGIRFRAQNKSSKPLNRTYLFVRFPGAIHKYQVFC